MSYTPWLIHCARRSPNYIIFCRQQHLQFRPPLEEIRSKFYREMRRFITIPLHFRGVGQGEGQLGKPQQTIFPRMIDRNAKGLLAVYRKVSGVWE